MSDRGAPWLIRKNRQTGAWYLMRWVRGRYGGEYIAVAIEDTYDGIRAELIHRAHH